MSAPGAVATASVLPWQQERWQHITTAITAGRLGHALLLAGPRGVGKAQFARALASYLLCEAPVAKRPCGACRSCVQIAAGVHPNLMRLQVAEDKREIAIDDIRDLLSRLQLSSHYGQAKVVIVQPADALNISGVNALLKTVEEPPAGTHLLFVAERWRALPPTLRSRCQIQRFAAPAAAQALAWLKQQFPGKSDAVLRPFVRAPLTAAAAFGDDAADMAQWTRALQELGEGNLGSLRLVQGLKREEAQSVLEAWLGTAGRWLRATVVPAAGAGESPPRGVTPARLERLTTDVLEGLRALDRASPSLLVESIMIRWAGGASGR